MSSAQTPTRQGVAVISKEIGRLPLGKGVDLPLWWTKRCDTDSTGTVWHHRTSCCCSTTSCNSTGAEVPQDQQRGGAQARAVKGLSRYQHSWHCSTGQSAHW